MKWFLARLLVYVAFPVFNGSVLYLFPGADLGDLTFGVSLGVVLTYFIIDPILAVVAADREYIRRRNRRDEEFERMVEEILRRAERDFYQARAREEFRRRFHEQAGRQRNFSRGSTGMSREKALTILGLSGNPDAASIKSAYRKAAMQWHPDRNGSSKEAEEKFKQINAAHEYLTA